MFKEPQNYLKVQLDAWLLSVIAVLLMIGILMVTSASSFTAEKYGVGSYYYSTRQIIFVVAGLVCSVVAYKISMEKLYIWSSLMVPLAGFF